MALTILLFRVSNLEVSKAKLPDDLSALSLCAKITFRGASLWSSAVPIEDDVANFLVREEKPSKFDFHLASPLLSDDKFQMEFYMTTMKRKKKKLLAVFEVLLESLIDRKSIDLSDENLSDPNNYLLEATLEAKLHYMPPNLSNEHAVMFDEGHMMDWMTSFDDNEQENIRSKRNLKRRRVKFSSHTDDTDTDSDTENDIRESRSVHQKFITITEEEKLKNQYNNLELLEKSLGRYDGDVYQMTDWQIMVHVIQGRDFSGLDINPYVCVQIDDQKRYTGVHRCSNSPFFGDFFTFDFSLPATQMMEKVIYFKVHHAKAFVSTFADTKAKSIFKVDVATVYNEKDRAFERKWAQLIDPDSIQTICGHLLLSVAISERGVSSKNILGEITQGDDELKPSKTFIPSAMPRNQFPVQLKLTFFTAGELPEMMTDFLTAVSKKFLRSDYWEPVDPYIEVTYNAIQATTNHRNGTSPVWSEALYLIGQFPPLVRTIKVALKDHAAIQQDRVISTFLIDLFAISESNPSTGFLPTFGPTWVFLYGSPREYSISKEHDGLGEGMGEGVCYKGRLLMSIECHPVSGDNVANVNVQKETGVHFPDTHLFPVKRTFLLFGCIYNVSMIDKQFGNTTISFELSIGSSGYLNINQLDGSTSATSLTLPYPRFPIQNNTRHFCLPIDYEKPILFTKYTFHDYSYRMILSNRLKRAAVHISHLIREFELNINSKVSSDVLLENYQQMEQYIYTLPCGCNAHDTVHSTLYELLTYPKLNLRMNNLDEKRRKKILHGLESLKTWITKEVDFKEQKIYETIKQLRKISRALRQLAIDVQPSLPDVFLWMMCDSKRVAYVRIPPEDILFSLCQGEKGLYNGHVQTFFLRIPRTSNQPIKSSTNAKVQIYLSLGIEDYEANIFKQLPSGYEKPVLPLTNDTKSIRYDGLTLNLIVRIIKNRFCILERSFYELRCHCYKARSLIASDETGLSDPYLSITAGNETQITPVLKESLCPQWNVTLVFRNLIHYGSRETAEEIVGNVVVECYDYDEANDGPDLIGRFSTTAKFDSANDDKSSSNCPFQWYEFKYDEKRAGELLALFELIEINPDHEQKQSLDEIAVTPEHFPPNIYITKVLKNKIYHIPHILMPDVKPYEIEVMFWGLRECRSINFLPIQQAEVSIECAGARITKTIKDVQKNPNFQLTGSDTDKYRLIVDLPKDNNFWPHLSIHCVQHRLFGMKEIVGNLVVTDLQKYLETPKNYLRFKSEEFGEPSSNRIWYDFNRVRKSVIDAYEAAIAGNDRGVANRQLSVFEKEAGLEKVISDNQEGFKHTEGDNDDTSSEERKFSAANTIDDTHRELTSSDRFKRNELEKTATWWSKYYASKAKLRLQQKPKIDPEEELQNSNGIYADFFDEESKTVVKHHWSLWTKAKQAFIRARKARKCLQTRAVHGLTYLSDKSKAKSVFDESLDIIETDRLKELTLLQTFEILETELENIDLYEGFSDCLDKFPLYKGKGTSRSDEIGDEKRVYAKFKGKFRIRELTGENSRRGAVLNLDRNHRSSVNPALFNAQIESMVDRSSTSDIRTNQQMLRFDLNRNPITLKCRLYIIKALLFRAWDRSGKADPYIKVLLNEETIIDDVKSRLSNTLEPVFGKSYEFDVTIPHQSLLRIQVWDWDLANVNDKIAETRIDIENRWFSCHRATCGLAKRYDSAGYNAWRDTKKPTIILEDLCRTANLNLPVYAENFYAVTIDNIRFDCDSECIEFVTNRSLVDMAHRKVHHESPEEYIRQNTALGALHSWAGKINSKCALVSEHIECRSLFDPSCPDVEQGKVEMWLDFFPMSRQPSGTPVDITPPKPTSYQLRLTIWNTTDVELNDENFVTGEKTSDIYVKAWILGEKEDGQQTDVHYRSLTGEGNFNWRLLFNFDYIDIEEKIVYEKKDSVFQIGSTVKKIPPRIVLRVYDADLLSADDFLGECILNLTHLPVGAKSSSKCRADMLLNSKHRALNLFVNKRTTGWWPMIAPIKTGEIRDVTLLGGKVEAELYLVTAEEAEQNPVGKGREGPQPLDEPNRPKNSFLWFTSPWKTFRYVIWRNFKWSIILGIIIFLIVLFLLLALWTLPGELVRQITNNIFKTTRSTV
ncbi:unnamed protein product [Adineta ricciae]|uniref:C2 domain-containing protein n=1 Tax=Adineta ricciae TaxID=249248 RepID=A0A814QCC7_ADIRI|nr:unnamed protein product [Adineta ricciae]